MPRVRRLTAPNCFYHIFNRGLNKRVIFRQPIDYQKFLSKLEILVREYDFSLYCYALLPNHFHLLLETGNVPLSKIMSKLFTSYSIYFNRKYKSRGPLFEDRYKSKVVQKESYFLELSRYIHLNPVKANLIRDPNDYPYSSLSEILSIKSVRDRRLIDKDKVQKLIGESKISLKQYQQFIYDGIGLDLDEFDPWRSDKEILGTVKFKTARMKKYTV